MKYSTALFLNMLQMYTISSKILHNHWMKILINNKRKTKSKVRKLKKNTGKVLGWRKKDYERPEKSSCLVYFSRLRLLRSRYSAYFLTKSKRLLTTTYLLCILTLCLRSSYSELLTDAPLHFEYLQHFLCCLGHSHSQGDLDSSSAF